MSHRILLALQFHGPHVGIQLTCLAAIDCMSGMCTTSSAAPARSHGVECDRTAVRTSFAWSRTYRM